MLSSNDGILVPCIPSWATTLTADNTYDPIISDGTPGYNNTDLFFWPTILQGGPQSACPSSARGALGEWTYAVV